MARKTTPSDRIEAEIQYRQGKSMSEIGQDLDIPKSTIGRWLKDIDRDPVTAPAAQALAEGVAAAKEGMTDFQLSKEEQGLLDNHLDIATAIASAVAAQRIAAQGYIEKALGLLIDVDYEAAIKSLDDEGNPPNEWTMFRRRTQVIQALNHLLKQTAELEAQFVSLDRTSIQLQRQAKGLDASQEVNAALARVMSMGFTVVR
jgi:transcriptional regulator with XRE-family HTH domain